MFRKLWNPLSLIKAAVPVEAVALEKIDRWSQVFNDQPKLCTDIIELGGILETREEVYEDGYVVRDPIDPTRAIYEQGQRDMALKLLALGGLSHIELNSLMNRNTQ